MQPNAQLSLKFDTKNTSKETPFMARITVEDCLEHVENRFQLVTLAAERAHQFHLYNARPHVDRENDKWTVVALREIADGILPSNLLDNSSEESEEQDNETPDGDNS